MKYRFSLDFLKTLNTFRNTPNMYACANQLGISQGAVSLRLKQVQEQLPHPLFEIHGRKKVLTAYAEALCREFHENFSHLSTAIERIDVEFSDPNKTILRVGARKELFPWALRKMAPHAALRLIELSSEETVESVLTGKIDIGITHLRTHVLHVQSRKLFTSGTRFAVHERWLKGRLLSSDLIHDPVFLRQTPCLSYGEEDRLLTKWLLHSGISRSKLSVRVTCEDWQVLGGLVADGHGFCILPDTFAVEQPGIKYLDIPESAIPGRTFHLLFQKHLAKSPVVRKVLRACARNPNRS